MWITQLQENLVYEAIRPACSGYPRFMLHDGQPYANGDIYIGHAANKILRTCLKSFKNMFDIS